MTPTNAEVRALIELLDKYANGPDAYCQVSAAARDALAALLARVEESEHEQRESALELENVCARARTAGWRKGVVLVEWFESIVAERDRLRAAIEGHCKAHCVHFRHLRVARFEGRHAPECLAYELHADDDTRQEREPHTEADRLPTAQEGH